jgi:DNA-binding NarL/FixJ family response regulator
MMPTTRSPSNPNITVFIVDDSRLIREHLVTMIDELTGIEVIGQVGTVTEAINTIQHLNPDVVILDLHLADGSGIDVLNKIKRDGIMEAMVIILTNYTFAGYRRKCLDAGADYFLDKSSEFDQIPKLFEQSKRVNHLVVG